MRLPVVGCGGWTTALHRQQPLRGPQWYL